MYEPQPVIFIVDFATVALLALGYLVALAVAVQVRAPGTRSLGAAAAVLTSLARSIEWRHAAIVLGAIVALLGAIGALVAYSTSDSLHVYIFRLNDERTIPTSFNGLQLLVTATLATLLARMNHGRARWAWLLFAVAFVLAAVDEASDVHGRFESKTGLPEEFLLAPLGAAVLAALVILWRQLRVSGPALPLLFAAGALVVASQGFDLISAIWSQRIVEEVLELGAGALFVLSLLSAIQAPEAVLRGRGLRYASAGADRESPSPIPNA